MRSNKPMQNILITGISKGLGNGLAHYYLEQGNQVYGISRKNDHDLDKNSFFSFLSMDLREFDFISSNIPNFLAEVKKLDLVILNAGIMNGVKDLRNTSLDEIGEVMNINVWANKVLIDVLFDSINKIEQLVAISSGASVSGSRGWNAYSLSKACLNMLISLYSKEHKDCHFTALAPGLIDTGMQDHISKLPGMMEEKFKLIRKLKDARGTEKMPDPYRAAPLIAEAIQKVRNFESGSFQDVRKL
jgi:NAD(P)-dependent dehydrogenase (short-subunit alcohol dehydrogenase family)